MRILKKLLKWTALVVLAGLLIGVILVGFSFFEGGGLAQSIMRELNLPAERQSVVMEIAKEKEELNPRAENITLPGYQGDIDPLQDQVRVIRSYTGDIKAKKIDASYGAVIVGDLTASHINISQATVYGNLKSERLVKVEAGGLVTGNIQTGDGVAEIDGEVRGNVEGKQVVLRSKAVIHGDVITSGLSVMMESGAQVEGNITNTENKPIKILKGSDGQERIQTHNSSPASGSEKTNVVVTRDNGPLGLAALWLPMLLGLLALLLMVYSFLNKDVQVVLDHVTNRPWKSLWTGILSLAVVIPVGFLLGLTIIGIPLAIALAAVAITAFILGLATIGSFIGEKVCGIFHLQFQTKIIETLIGMFLLVHLLWVPVLGWFALFVLSLMGFGGVAPIWWPRFKDWWKNRKVKKQQEPTQSKPAQAEQEKPEQDPGRTED